MRNFILGLVIISLASAGLFADKPVNYTMNFSYGFRDKDAVYFLLEYKVWKARSPLWFIMPIERAPQIYFQKIFLYRYLIEENRLDRQAVVREDFPPGVDVQGSKFTKDGGAVVFAYPAGRDARHTLLYEIRVWDIAGGRFLDLDGTVPAPAGSPAHQKYFGDYKSPWASNPGVIGITELKKVIMKDVTPEQWDLPREW